MAFESVWKVRNRYVVAIYNNNRSVCEYDFVANSCFGFVSEHECAITVSSPRWINCLPRLGLETVLTVIWNDPIIFEFVLGYSGATYARVKLCNTNPSCQK